MLEPFETRDALLGLGRRFICKGCIAEGGYLVDSMPGKGGRFEGKGGCWRDILRRFWDTVASRVTCQVWARLLCNNSTRLLLHASLSVTFVKGHYSLYAHPGNTAIEPLDRRE